MSDLDIHISISYSGNQDTKISIDEAKKEKKKHIDSTEGSVFDQTPATGDSGMLDPELIDRFENNAGGKNGLWLTLFVPSGLIAGEAETTTAEAGESETRGDETEIPATGNQAHQEDTSS